MADETTNTPTEQESTGQVQPPAEAQNTEPGPVPYNRFKEVNEELAELRKWRKAQEVEQTKAQKAAAEAEDAKLKEKEEWQELAEKREQDARAAEARLREYRLKDLMRQEADKQGLKFANATAEADAFRALQAEGALDDIDDTGKGIDALLKSLKETRGYLFAQAPQPSSIDANAGRGSGAPINEAALKQKVIETFRIR